MSKLAILTAVTVLFISCSHNEQDGPSEIFFGEDICDRCKMIISEKEFAAQYRLSEGDTVKFDDIGCMIHYLNEVESRRVESVYVTDYFTGDWINADEANFLWTRNITTPMGYGIISLKDKNKTMRLEKAKDGNYIGGFNAATDYIINENREH